METSDLPLFRKVRRSLSGMPPIDVETVLDAEWERLGLDARVTGLRIAIGVGSRGIQDLPRMIRRLVERVRLAGGRPFIVPAMGSHGGATSAGQTETLAGLGIREADMGCPIEATMDTVVLGQTRAGLPVHFDSLAAAADGVMILNRVKMHTSFHGPLESGLHKMIAIGMGKEKAATLLHALGPTGLREQMPEAARVILGKINFLAGFGVVEDGYHRPVILQGLPAGQLEQGEKALLELARGLAPSLPLREIDVLVVDAIGKDVSGTGMDTNVIGRVRVPGEAEPEWPKVKAVVVFDLTDGSHGNAQGIGLADFTTRKALDKVDWRLTAANVLASGNLERGKVPLVFPDAAIALRAAIDFVFRGRPAEKGQARVVRIRNTLELGNFQISDNLLPEIRQQPGFLEASEPVAFCE